MLTKMVNGESIIMSAQEEADVRAQWAAADAAQIVAASTAYIDQRNGAISGQAGSLLTALFNDITAGTALNAGTFYAEIQAINKQYPAPVVQATSIKI